MYLTHNLSMSNQARTIALSHVLPDSSEQINTSYSINIGPVSHFTCVHFIFLIFCFLLEGKLPPTFATSGEAPAGTHCDVMPGGAPWWIVPFGKIGAIFLRVIDLQDCPKWSALAVLGSWIIDTMGW
ncbi:hypothetical protein JTE90_013337 [Oedothorax gibbosus]|uniref:Uncharacterized protein n=1 Tax=Oedothorax gibbosus TaxID=931172 RepID=A0AAV6VDH3_9ARAC|nr:hypothetical protein JTE90_013337 [Oedothorax gibbosus]